MAVTPKSIHPRLAVATDEDLGGYMAAAPALLILRTHTGFTPYSIENAREKCTGGALAEL